MALKTAAKLNAVTATAAELNKMDGVTATPTEINYNDVTTLGTVQASKNVTADANKDVTGFRNITATGAVTTGTLTLGGTAISKTAAQINDLEVKTKVVTLYGASGAIAVTDNIALLGADEGVLAMTLADGYNGQVIKINCIDATNNAVVTPAHFGSGTTITFDADNEFCELVFKTNTWLVVATNATVA